MALISFLVAVARNGVIGRDNKLPWHLPAELKRFKEISMGKPMLMGRKTYESIGKPLPHRRNIIITRNADYGAPGIEVAQSLEEAIEMCGDVPEIVIIGGGEIFKLAMPIADRMYYTVVLADIAGDAYFPEVDWTQWRETAREPGPPSDPPFEFRIYERAA